jgi:hypothetical protein
VSPIDTGQLDVEDRDVRAMLERGGDDLVAGRGRGHHVKVVLESQHGDECVAQDAHVPVDQHADHLFLP